MRNLLLATLLLHISVSAHSQYFVNESSLWSCSEQGTDWVDAPFTVYWIKFEGDTLIGDYEYKSILKSSDSLQSAWITVGYVREDSLGRVYKKNYAEEDEFITFDFSMQQGDSIYEWGDYYHYVESVESKPFGTDQKDRKHINFQWFSWIEGVGSLSGPLWGLDMVDYLATGTWFRLLCYFENGKLVYHNEEFSSCFPVSVPALDHAAREIKVTATVGAVRFQTEGLDTKQAQLHIHDITGRLVYLRTLSGEAEWEVPTDGLMPGVYIYRLVTAKGLLAGKFYAD